MKIGYFLSSEEWGPQDLVAQSVKAQDAGFDGLWISDHYHPWNDEQGHSPFVWSTIGAIAQATSGMKVTTAVTCPTIRIHPAIIAEAAATCAVMLDGNFCLGLGSGEALNEHIVGGRWPEADERLEMLEEAVDVIRTLWRGGAHDHRGRHYRIVISGFGPKSIELAAQPDDAGAARFGEAGCRARGMPAGDGYCTVGPDAESVKSFRSQARNGQLVQGGLKVCWDRDESEAVKTVHRLWPNEGLPGELAQILPTPEHFEQASELVTEEMLAEQVPCGPDVERHVEAITTYADGGFDELYVNQIGPEQDAFFEAYRAHILLRVR
jgi:G6PDH family F420-dependent oxidoreductase